MSFLNNILNSLSSSKAHRFICAFFLVIFFQCIFVLNSIAFEDTKSVVKIFVTSNSIDYYRPWQSKGMQTSGGSGSIIEGNQILTNAHVVTDATFIQVKKDGDSKKYVAKVKAIGHDCDLALLTVEDGEFFEDTKPIQFGKLPKLQDAVVVLGYPLGGGKISITEGVVSRIEMTSYSQSGRHLLAVQIDAAINPGNSGGPVIQNGKMVGVAMQVFVSGQNIGYMIPNPIIDHFLEDLKDGNYDGFPVIGISYDNTESSTLRKYYKLDKFSGGVLVNRVLPFSPAEGEVLEHDVILEVDGVKVEEDGTFKFRKGERLMFPFLITKRQLGDDVELKIVRDGELKTVRVKLEAFKPLVSYSHHYEKPPYFIYGGLVFTVVSTDLLQSWGNRWWEVAPIDYSYFLAGNGRINTESKEEIVVLLSVIPDDINIGYHNFGNSVVTKINDKIFGSLKEFVELVNAQKDSQDYVVFETMDKSQIILQNENVDNIDKEILKRNNIPYQYSDDVQSWINSPSNLN